MTKSSHATAWASDAPTPAQMKELFAQIESGRVTKNRLQEFLRGQLPEPTEEETKFRVSLYRAQPPEHLVPESAGKYWDRVVSGAGPHMAIELSPYLSRSFRFHLQPAGANDGILDVGVSLEDDFFGPSGINISGLRAISPSDFDEKSSNEWLVRKDRHTLWLASGEVVSILRYDFSLEEYLQERLERLGHFIPYDLTFLRKVHDALSSFPPLVDEDTGYFRPSRRFWQCLKKDIKMPFLFSALRTSCGDVIDAHFDISLVANLVSCFLPEEDAYAMGYLTCSWLEGNYPIGLDGERHLLVLCASS